MELTLFCLDKKQVLKEALNNSLGVMYCMAYLFFENIGMPSRYIWTNQFSMSLSKSFFDAS